MHRSKLVWVRGAGELGSAVAHLLYRVGYSVFMSDISPPLAIRRPVTFSNALLDGMSEVEEVRAIKKDSSEPLPPFPWKHILIFEDAPEKLLRYSPVIIIDARMLKHYTEDYRNWANLVIGLGPGFDTDKNCHRAIETMRGHDLARVITSGRPLADTGKPGILGGESSKRLVRAPMAGQISWQYNFGDLVTTGQQIGLINNSEPVLAGISGMIRGMISPDTPVQAGMKIGDIDPRGGSIKYRQLSEKARAIAAGVFEAVVLVERIHHLD